MSLIPVFKVGIGNAWLFVALFLLLFYGLSRLIVSKKAALFVWPHYTKKEKRILLILMVCMFFPMVYSIFLPLKIDTAWFYVGLLIYLAGIVFVMTAVLNFATTPPDKPVTKGIYRLSRNPIDFGSFLIFISIGIASASWLVLLVAGVFLGLMGAGEIAEERMCLEKFGKVYREYMNKTPRWIGIPKSTNFDKSR
jgi:protein-S-isoprenylcysteine O-methyltransferase Ste14